MLLTSEHRIEFQPGPVYEHVARLSLLAPYLNPALKTAGDWTRIKAPCGSESASSVSLPWPDASPRGRDLLRSRSSRQRHRIRGGERSRVDVRGVMEQMETAARWGRRS